MLEASDFIFFQEWYNLTNYYGFVLNLNIWFLCVSKIYEKGNTGLSLKKEKKMHNCKKERKKERNRKL